MRITEISCIIKEGIKEQSVSEDRQVTELKKFFNVNGSCNPQIHYMIDLSERLSEIKKMVDAGEYFTINRARQYGKTTLLAALAECIFRKNRALAPHERSAVPLGTDHCPVC